MTAYASNGPGAGVAAWRFVIATPPPTGLPHIPSAVNKLPLDRLTAPIEVVSWESDGAGPVTWNGDSYSAADTELVWKEIEDLLYLLRRGFEQLRAAPAPQIADDQDES